MNSVISRGEAFPGDRRSSVRVHCQVHPASITALQGMPRPYRPRRAMTQREVAPRLNHTHPDRKSGQYLEVLVQSAW